jgi:hypothetical protein
MWKARTACVALLTIAGALLAPTAASAATPDNVLVSARSGTGPLGSGVSNGRADRPQISGNGRYVTFDSAATNLDPRDTTNDIDVYRRDLQTGATELVSVGTTACPEGTTGQLAICNTYSWPSDDGNVVAFTSDKGITTATVPGRRVYVRDMAAGTSEMVSVNSEEKGANGASGRPMVSGTGRFVAFTSKASNLSPLGGNGTDLVYLRDRQLGTTTLVSTTHDGKLPTGTTASGDANESYRGIVSDDGQTVVYASQAGDIVPGDTNNREDIFVKNMVTGATERVSMRANGTQALGGGARPYMSPDGRYVLFNTYDPIVPQDTNGKSDVYMVDLTTSPRTSTWVSEGRSSTVNSGDSLRGFVTDDGRYAVFNSFANNLVERDFNGGRGDAFIRDMATGTTHLLSLSSTGSGANGQSFRPVPSSDGSVVTFLSIARNLVAGDTSDPSQYQVYAVRTASLFTAPDTTAPTATVQTPAANATLPNPVTFSGSASDDRGVAGVQVAVRRGTTTVEWLQQDGTTWGSAPYRFPATLATPNGTSTTWSLRLPNLPDGSYGSQTSAQDTSGNQAARPWVSFKVATPSTDATPPTVTVTSPAPKASVSNPVTFSGTATDDVAVSKVGVAIRRGTNEWLQANGTWVANVQYRFQATLDAPGRTSTGWTLTLPHTLDAGSYGASTTAWDSSNNQPATKPWTPFTVVSP